MASSGSLAYVVLKIDGCRDTLVKWKFDRISDIQHDILQNKKILSDHLKGLNHACDLNLISC